MNYVIFGASTVLLSIVGAAVIGYIEGLRLDSISYARVVNSIRAYFFALEGAEKFGAPVLPTEKSKPAYDGFGAGSIIYFACGIINAAYFSAGVLALMLDRSVPLTETVVSGQQWCISVLCFFLMLGAQILIRLGLLSGKRKKGF
jgi:hypothetical protein